MQQHDNGTAFKDKEQARFHKSLRKQPGANDLFDKDLIGFTVLGGYLMNPFGL
jgi:hypothetical protein